MIECRFTFIIIHVACACSEIIATKVWVREHQRIREASTLNMRRASHAGTNYIRPPIKLTL